MQHVDIGRSAVECCVTKKDAREAEGEDILKIGKASFGV